MQPSEKRREQVQKMREKRTKGKSYDIPTMVAHLSAAVRVYGPVEPESSSESDEEQERREPATQAATEDPKVNIFTHIKAWSNPENISLPTPRRKLSDLLEIMGKAKTHKQFFEASESLTKHAVEEHREDEEKDEEEGNAADEENDQPQAELEVNYSPDGDSSLSTPPVVPNM